MNSIERARKVAVDWMELPLAEDGAIETEALVNLVATALTETRTKALEEAAALVRHELERDTTGGWGAACEAILEKILDQRLKAEGGEI